MRLFNNNNQSGFEIVIMNRKPGVFRWKMVDENKTCKLLPPVNVNKFDSFDDAANDARSVFKQLGVRIEDVEPELTT